MNLKRISRSMNEETVPVDSSREVNATPVPTANAHDVHVAQSQHEKSSPGPRRLLRFAHIAEIVVKLQRSQKRATLSALHFQRNTLVVESSSGEEPATHSGLTELLRHSSSVTSEEGHDVNAPATPGLNASTSLSKEPAPVTALKRRARVELADIYICMDGVDASKLLRATRTVLYERTEGLLGICLLVDES